MKHEVSTFKGTVICVKIPHGWNLVTKVPCPNDTRTLPPFHPFPSALSKFRRRFDIQKLISVKKVQYHNSTTPNNPPPSCSSHTKNATNTNTNPHPLLGIMLTNSSPLSQLLYKAITHVCITHTSNLHICGNPLDGLHHRTPQITHHPGPTNLGTRYGYMPC
jgi:hypothetical protein